MFTFTPLLGAQTKSEATQSVLEFDGGVRVLVDVGWDQAFDSEQLKEVEKQASTISLVLLTHPTVSHLGAFAYLCKYAPSFKRIPVYATTPVISLGRTLLQDVYMSTMLASARLTLSSIEEAAPSPSNTADGNHILLPPPSNEEIIEYFSSINALKYSQPHQPVPAPNSPPLEGLTITAYRAGHTLGGTIWHIQHGSESVVYAVDWNHTRENILSGAAWLGNPGSTGAEVIEPLRRPTALICSSRGADITTQSVPWAKRDSLLLNHIRSTLKTGGTVLIPCDSSARSLELSYILEKAWNEDTGVLGSAKLFLASKSCGATMRFASSMLEWMDENIVREFETIASAQGRGQNGNASTQPFDFRHLKLIDRKSQLDRALNASGPKVFLASDSTLEWGFSRDILRKVAGQPGNLVILPSNPECLLSLENKDKSSLDVELAKVFKAKRDSAAADDGQAILCDEATIKLREANVTFLSGDDLSVYQQYLTEQRQREAAIGSGKSADLENSADVVDQDDASSSSSDDEESDTEQQGRALNMSTAMNTHKHRLGLTDEELGVNVLLRRRNVHDYDVQGKRGRERMYPYLSKRRRNDAFGDLIRPEDYLRAEERDEQDGQDLRASGLGQEKDNIGQKRKWDSLASNAGPERGQRHPNDSSKAVNRKAFSAATNGVHDASDDESASDESDYEPAEATISGPSRVTFKDTELLLKCKLTAVDYSGLHDRRSLQMLIPLIHPRKLILTGGTEASTQALASDCRRLLLEDTLKAHDNTEKNIIFIPVVGETIDASVETNAWTIRLSQTLYRELQWQRFRGLGLVTVNGQVDLSHPEQGGNTADENDSSEPTGKRLKTATEADVSALKHAPDAGKSEEDKKAALPILNPLNALVASAATANASNALQSIHVGDLRLAELRKILAASGQHTAEFKGEGTLLVDGCVVVRKNGVGKIEVETAGIRPSFIKVKKRIYDGLALVAAR